MTGDRESKSFMESRYCWQGKSRRDHWEDEDLVREGDEMSRMSGLKSLNFAVMEIVGM